MHTTDFKPININELDYYQMLYLNRFLKYNYENIVENEEIRQKNSKHKLIYVYNNLSSFDFLNDIEINDIEKYSIELCINNGNYDQLLISVKLDDVKDNKNKNLIHRKAIKYFSDIIERIKNDSNYIDNYFYEAFELGSGTFSGYYNLGNIELDFGLRQEIYPKPIVVKTKIKYKIVNNKLIPNKMVDSLKIDRAITLNLIQLFLRTSFSTVKNGQYYNASNIDNIFELNTASKGSFINEVRDGFSKYQANFVSSDIPKLFDIFNKLTITKKNVFLRACEAYVEGLHATDGKELLYYIIALETLVDFEYGSSDNKESMIYDLICTLFNDKIISKEYIEYIYNVRSRYVHEGYLSNNIYNQIFNTNELNVHLLSQVESISYSTLIKWLIKEDN